METYKKLEARFAEVMALQQVDGLLGWDAAVMMPPRGAAQRAQQRAVIGVKAHELTADPQTGAWIADVDPAALDDWQRANLRIMGRMHLHASAVPAPLVEKRALQDAKTEITWRQARAAGDFSAVRPELEKTLELVRAYGEAKAGALGVSPYEALMDSYVPHMRAAEVDAIFDDLAAFLPPFLDDVLARQEESVPLAGPFPPDAQEKLCRRVAEALGFDFSGGRLDTSAHPFSSGLGDDVRITTRYNPDDFMEAMQGVAHEAGHAFYDRSIPAAWRCQPVGSTHHMGMAVHESQSLSLDMVLGRGAEYWAFFAPAVQEAFGRSGPDLTAENLRRLAKKVSRGFIRVDADEVTYPAHVILRYRLEKGMISGALKVADLPEAWNAGMRELLGMTPPDDRLGCLQDIHWYGGDFGYFPAYTLGAVIAAQLAEKMGRDVPDLQAQVRRGNFSAFTGWLKDNVQAQAGLYTPPELIERATGEKLSVRAFKAHLAARYQKEEEKGEAACSATSAQGARRRI